MRVRVSQLRSLRDLIVQKMYLDSDFVKKPKSESSVISDLFIWRSNNSWKTYFELLDIYGLISCDLPGSPERESTIIFFNKDGKYLFEKILRGNDFARNTISINDLLEESRIPTDLLGTYGTFAVFHSIDNLIEANSLLTDRGYCGYEFSKSKFRGYVHGNFDAVTRYDQNFEFLMGYGKFVRPYNLQHILTGPSEYDIALVNPTNTAQKLKVIISKGEEKNVAKLHLPSGGVAITKISLASDQHARVNIVSKMFMARPSVFRYTLNTIDVFHG